MADSLRLYPNGMPHLSRKVRRRMVYELLTLALLTGLYLLFFPKRPLGVDVGMALVALGLVGLTRTDTRDRVWGPPPSAKFVRIRRCTINMILATVPPVVFFCFYGGVHAYIHHRELAEVGYRLFKLNFFIAMLLYVPWALLQQTLFQFYLLGRLRGIFPFASPLLLSVINGILYGAIHLPNPRVAAVTIIGGVIWSYSYHRDRFTLPIALSHAILASTFYYWVLDYDLIGQHFPMLSGG